MLENYESLNTTQKKTFTEIANKLLSYTFLARDKKDNKENYYFVQSFKDVFDDFFKILGYEVIMDQALGTVMLESSSNSNYLRLKRDETVILLILRLLYNERLKETTLNENIIISVSDIHEKYNYLELRKHINKTDLERTLRMFRKYNLIEVVGDVTMANTKVVILPTILCAIKTSDINEIHNYLQKILSEVAD